MRRDNVLFARATVSDAMRALLAEIPGRVQAVAESVLRAVDEEVLILQLAEPLKITPLQLDRSGQSMRREETTVDVTGDPLRLGFRDGRRMIVPGVRVTVSIPYVGDEQLWQLRPSTYRLSSPQGVVHAQRGVDRGVIDIVVEQPTDQPVERIKAELESTLDDITFAISNQEKDLAGSTEVTTAAIRDAIRARKARLQKHDSLSELLGIPESVARSPTTDVVVPRTESRNAASPSGAEQVWDVFVSHASEDKQAFVRPLVAALGAAGLRVWFDESELRLGDGLRRSIDRGLARSRYGVVIISRAFLSKQWPQRELDGLIAREDDGSKVVLPIWHDISAQEVRQSSPILADRLAVSSDRGIDEVVREIVRVVRPANA